MVKNNQKLYYTTPWAFPGGSVGKESACHTRDLGSIPGSGRPPVEGHDNPLQYSCLENPMGRGAWGATVHGAAELDTTELVTLSHFHYSPLQLVYFLKKNVVQGLSFLLNHILLVCYVP